MGEYKNEVLKNFKNFKSEVNTFLQNSAQKLNNCAKSTSLNLNYINNPYLNSSTIQKNNDPVTNNIKEFEK